jgi:exodeoxyribonuclease III
VRGESLTLATWNVNSIKVRAPQVLAWLGEARPDVLGLQELKVPEERFPATLFQEARHHAAVHGQKTYNGVALISRLPLDDVQRGIPELAEDPQARIVTGRWGDVCLINVYVPNGESVESDKYQYKLGWLETLARHLEAEHSPDEFLVLLGDFNIAPDERDIHDPVLYKDKVLFSDPEHAALERLTRWGLVDVFRIFHTEPKLYSWWDYRMNAFRRNMGARLDLILATRPMAERAVSCGIDLGPRRAQQPSDHAPVVARFEWGQG